MQTGDFYIHVAMSLTSVALSVVFFIAWKTLLSKRHALSWSLAFLAAAAQWYVNINRDWFPSGEAHWLTVSAFGISLVVLGLLGHCQRTGHRQLSGNLWLLAGVAYVAIFWATVLQPHAGIRMATLPTVATVALFLSAWVIMRYRRRPQPAELATAVTMVLFGVSQGIAAGIALLQGATGVLEYATLYQQYSYLTAPAGYIAIGMFTILMLASDISEDMKEIAVRDQLTGVFNRRGLGEQGAMAYATARRTDAPLTVVMIDIDRFKIINDEFGHAAGDAALCHFAELLREDRRASDILARVGGEEFALVMPGTGLREAMAVADKLRERVESSPLEFDDARLKMTSSFGVATLNDSDTCLSDTIVRADRALYRSKRAGRNQVDLESSQLMRTADGSLRPVST